MEDQRKASRLQQLKHRSRFVARFKSQLLSKSLNVDDSLTEVSEVDSSRFEETLASERYSVDAQLFENREDYLTPPKSTNQKTPQLKHLEVPEEAEDLATPTSHTPQGFSPPQKTPGTVSLTFCKNSLVVASVVAGLSMLTCYAYARWHK